MRDAWNGKMLLQEIVFLSGLRRAEITRLAVKWPDSEMSIRVKSYRPNFQKNNKTPSTMELKTGPEALQTLTEHSNLINIQT